MEDRPRKLGGGSTMTKYEKNLSLLTTPISSPLFPITSSQVLFHNNSIDVLSMFLTPLFSKSSVFKIALEVF